MVAVLAGEASVEESRRVMEWRAASSENEERFARLEKFWRRIGGMVPDADGTPPSSKAIVEIAEQRRSIHEVPAAPAGREMEPPPEGLRRFARSGSRLSHWVPVGIAAALVAGLGVGILLGGDAPGFGPDSFVTGDGEVATVMLQDETVVRLAPQSRLVFSGDERDREVSLFGRAYFAVSRDENRPFRVRLPSGDVEVLGTRFDVEGRGRGIQVAVVEGEVRMDVAGARLNVHANQVGRMTEGQSPALEEVEDVYRVIDWLDRFLVFESTSLSDVAREFNGRFGLQVQIRDPELREHTVTGWFAGQSPEEMIEGVCRVIDARCTVRDGSVIMEQRS